MIMTKTNWVSTDLVESVISISCYVDDMDIGPLIIKGNSVFCKGSSQVWQDNTIEMI